MDGIAGRGVRAAASEVLLKAFSMHAFEFKAILRSCSYYKLAHVAHHRHGETLQLHETLDRYVLSFDKLD